MARICKTCGIFQKEGWIIENPADESSANEFPEAFHKLVSIQIKQKEDESHYYLQCPDCGLVYEYQKSSPGGSYDAMRTWIVEKLIPVMKHGMHLRKNISPKTMPVEVVKEFICPYCKSYDIEVVNAGNIGGEVFITLKCRKCGVDDTLDQYQLMNWKNVSS